MTVPSPGQYARQLHEASLERRARLGFGKVGPARAKLRPAPSWAKRPDQVALPMVRVVSQLTRDALLASAEQRAAMSTTTHAMAYGGSFAIRDFIDVGYRGEVQSPPSPRQIITAVEAAHQIPFGSIKGDGRTRPIAAARHEAIWIVRQIYPEYSLPRIGRLFGGRDHTTILYALRKHEKARRQ